MRRLFGVALVALVVGLLMIPLPGPGSSIVALALGVMGVLSATALIRYLLARRAAQP